MRSCTSSTSRSRMRTLIAPSPSTRARAAVLIRRLRGGSSGAAIALTFALEGGCARVERAVHANQVDVVYVELAHPGAQRCGVGRLHRPEAAVATAIERRAQRTATGVRHRAQAGRAVSDHDAVVAAQLALLADARGGDRCHATAERGPDHLEQLILVDRAALQLEIDRDVGADRRRV